jgi:uncharacterized protein
MFKKSQPFILAIALSFSQLNGAVDIPQAPVENRNESKMRNDWKLRANVDLHNEETSKLTLISQATMLQTPDELQLTVGVVSIGDTAESALQTNNTNMQSVIQALDDIGLSKSDFETGRFNIHPLYAPYPKDANENWQPKITGYEVTNSILIHTNQLNLAGKIIDMTSKAGANKIDDIRFVLHNPHEYWGQVISQATTQAMEDAKTIAQAAHVSLVRILSINLDNTNMIVPRIALYHAKSNLMDTPIEQGNVTLTASISIVFQIESPQL